MIGGWLFSDHILQKAAAQVLGGTGARPPGPATSSGPTGKLGMAAAALPCHPQRPWTDIMPSRMFFGVAFMCLVGAYSYEGFGSNCASVAMLVETVCSLRCIVGSACEIMSSLVRRTDACGFDVLAAVAGIIECRAGFVTSSARRV